MLIGFPFFAYEIVFRWKSDTNKCQGEIRRADKLG